jgi:hypothetical protein
VYGNDPGRYERNSTNKRWRGATMLVMARTKKETSPRLGRDASLGEVIEAVNELAAESADRWRVSAPEPLDEPPRVHRS